MCKEDRGLALKVLLWNVHGLNSSPHVLSAHFAAADLLLPTQTWTYPRVDAPAIPGYTCFSSFQEYIHAQAVRSSGGVACYIKDSMAIHLELWKVPSPRSMLRLESKHKFVQVMELITSMLPLSTCLQRAPHLSNIVIHSPSWSSFSKMLHRLQHTIDWCYRREISMHVLAADAPGADIAGDLPDTFVWPAICTRLPLRKSAGTKVCPFGKSLLSICQSSDMDVVCIEGQRGTRWVLTPLTSARL